MRPADVQVTTFSDRVHVLLRRSNIRRAATRKTQIDFAKPLAETLTAALRDRGFAAQRRSS